MRLVLCVALLLSVPTLCLAQNDNQAPPATTAPPPPTDAQKKSISAANAAIAPADPQIANANSLQNQATILANHLNGLPDSPASTSQALQQIDALYPLLREAASSNLVSQMTSQSKALADQKTKVDNAKAALGDTSSAAPTEIQSAAADCDKASKSLNESKTSLDQASADLKTALPKAYAFFTASFSSLDLSIKPLMDLSQNEPNIETIRQILDEQAPEYALQLAAYPKLKADWDKSNPLISSLLRAADQAAPVTTKANSVSSDLNAVLPKFKPWFDSLNDSLKKTADTANTTGTSLSVDFDSAYDAAVAQDNSGRTLRASLTHILAAWDSVSANIPVPAPTGFSAQPTQDSVANLRKSLGDLAAALLKIEDSLSGDRQHWMAAQVRLYYFTDVPRLMEILNPNVIQEGGISDAADKAGAARKNLLSADLTLANARADVNKFQNQVVTLQEELRQAQADVQAKGVLFTQTSKLVNRLTSRQTSAKAKADASAANLTSADPIKKAVAEKDKNNLDSVTSQLTAAQQSNDTAQKDRDASQQRLDSAQDAQQGLPAKIDAAKRALEDAQANVNNLQNAALLAAQDASDALAAARDHTPHLRTTAIATSTDPAHRVEIFGFTDSKSIFIRGARPDVEKVKGLIAQFDTPAPQARITLWSLQLNSAGDRNNKSTKNFNKALGMIEGELSNSRALLSASLSTLRDSLNKVVNNTDASCRDKVTKAATPNHPQNELQRLVRIRCFYSEQVLAELGLQESNPDFPALSKLILKDPAGTTTLGESLMVLSLGKLPLRQQVWTEFNNDLHDRLQGLNLSWLGSKSKRPSSFPFENDTDTFSLTARALNLDRTEVDGEEMSPTQKELLYALESNAIQRFLQRASILLGQLTEAQSAKQLLEKMPNAATDPKLQRRMTGLDVRMATLNKQLEPLLDYLYDRTGMTLDQVRDYLTGSGSPGLKQIFDEIAARTTPRVAAADEMLKEMMIAVEDDLDRLFVHPFTLRLRDNLVDIKGLKVGVLQKTSLLATNRLVASVDPHSSAQLALGQETDILQSLLQLGEVFAAAKLGGPLAALNSLNAEKREAPPEIYSLNTGSKFEVTPVFDPSGQALRFKFDYVAGTQIQEPNGTTNLQLPRIERHNVNTEVQISNMEIREISRFEANSKLGIPTSYWGGVPILKDIPYVRPYIPLLGWFVRKAGHDAASQESIIFGQTTIYPTISDIMDLLTSSHYQPNKIS